MYNGDCYDMPSDRGTYGAECTVDFPHNQNSPWCETCYNTRRKPTTNQAEELRYDAPKDRRPSEPVVWQASSYKAPEPIKPQIRRRSI